MGRGGCLEGSPQPGLTHPSQDPTLAQNLTVAEEDVGRTHHLGEAVYSKDNCKLNLYMVFLHWLGDMSQGTSLQAWWVGASQLTQAGWGFPRTWVPMEGWKRPQLDWGSSRGGTPTPSPPSWAVSNSPAELLPLPLQPQPASGLGSWQWVSWTCLFSKRSSEMGQYTALGCQGRPAEAVCESTTPACPRRGPGEGRK